jgi:ribosomal protein S18 acetylase RimI-like enzyme
MAHVKFVHLLPEDCAFPMPQSKEQSASLSESITLRPAVPEDNAFLFRVYASTRADEMAATGWLEIEQRTFLRMQFKLQQAGYEAQFPQAEHNIILRDGEAIGRIIVDRTLPDEIIGVDVALLPDFRSAGVGTYLIQNLLDEARAAEKPFRIQVERHNLAAFRLYERLGFARLGEGATHISMEWSGPQ